MQFDSPNVVLISGPSGVGKTTFVNNLVNGDSSFTRLVAYTTRVKREVEVDGQDYHFINAESYKEMLNAGQLGTSFEEEGNFYGYGLEDIEQAISGDGRLVLEVNATKIEAFHKYFPNAAAFYLHPENNEMLKVRMSERGDDQTSIRKRMKLAEREAEAYRSNANLFTAKLVITAAHSEMNIVELFNSAYRSKDYTDR